MKPSTATAAASETRRVTVIHDVAWLQQRHEWPGLRGLVIVDSTRKIGAKTERETRYYLTSSSWRADRLGPMARDHWAAENGLRWVMDMTLRDDERRIRTDNAPRTSSPSNIWPSTSPARPKVQTPSASPSKPPLGMRTISPNSSPHNVLHPILLHPQRHSITGGREGARSRVCERDAAEEEAAGEC